MVLLLKMTHFGLLYTTYYQINSCTYRLSCTSCSKTSGNEEDGEDEGDDDDTYARCSRRHLRPHRHLLLGY